MCSSHGTAPKKSKGQKMDLSSFLADSGECCEESRMGRNHNGNRVIEGSATVSVKDPDMERMFEG
jgi:hypothetical protein